jgi:hypothetical protein
MRDMRDRGLEQWMCGLEPLVVLDVAPAHHGAERDARVRNPDSAQIGELAKVDEQRRLGQAEGEHRHQALAAGDRLGVIVGGEKLHRFRKCGRAGVVEGRQFHDLDASFALYATRSMLRTYHRIEAPVNAVRNAGVRRSCAVTRKCTTSPDAIDYISAEISRANIRRVQHADDPWLSPLAGWHQRRQGRDLDQERRAQGISLWICQPL